jgi:hypothetical protein
MATIALFVTLDELKKRTNLNGNIDADKLIPSLKTAQQLELEPILGTDLYNKMSNDIISGSLSGDYLDLKNNYIVDMLIHFAVSYYLPFSAYSIANAGITKASPENTTAIDADELTMLVNREKAMGESYKVRLINYIDNNTSKFPEYSTNSGSDISPEQHTNRTTLNLNIGLNKTAYECNKDYWGFPLY